MTKNNEELAIFGGPKIIDKKFPPYNPYGKEEVKAAKRVVKSGILSKFLGIWHEDFYGGKMVKAFERAWEKHFEVKHAVAVNSATSGLMAALGAVGIEPGDEVIVSPWTMSATATAILVWNGIPVFADIEPDTFNLDPSDIEKKITPLTRAIVVTDIFGHGADLKAIIKIARKHGLKVIEDAAQAPGAKYHEKFVGTNSDIGVFSLNYHKHIHTGEGGVCVTDDPALAERMQLIRNHGESVVSGKGLDDISNIIGFNFRMGEIEAAMGLEQLKKLTKIASDRSKVGNRLTRELTGLKGLKTPVVKKNCTHVYYVYPMVIDGSLKTGKGKIVDALQAEGVPAMMRGYLNLHLLPMYQRMIAYGKKGFPWKGGCYKGKVSYKKGVCPVAEELHEKTFIGLMTCAHDFNDKEIRLVVKAFKKVWKNLERLK